mgnify:CR=1 FL=1
MVQFSDIQAAAAGGRVGTNVWDSFTTGFTNWVTGFGPQMQGTAKRIFGDSEFSDGSPWAADAPPKEDGGGR